ncbi:hypothetical protein LCGC14_2575270 [marine sediment metagenome]|uniref:Uncharacterized protein n=1 Tax=marine sediment metagenome TaxID=412755 RepID=A0A0F9D8T2_9ZZZZ
MPRANIRDYKDWMQERAEELAELLYHQDFHSLCFALQDRAYKAAQSDYHEALAERVDSIRMYRKERLL